MVKSVINFVTTAASEHACREFNNAVDHLVMKDLLKCVNPDILKGFANISHAAGEAHNNGKQVAARLVGDLSAKDTTRTV